MTKGLKRAWANLPPTEQEHVKGLVEKWHIKLSDALRLFLGRESRETVLLKYDRTPDGRTIHRTTQMRGGSHDALSRKLPGSFESSRRQ